MSLETQSIRFGPILALVGLATSGFLAVLAFQDPEGLTRLSDEYGWRATLILLPLQTLISLSLSPLPSDFVGFALALGLRWGHRGDSVQKADSAKDEDTR